MDISGKIISKALELGFLDCGILPVASLPEEKKHLQNWLNNHMHGQMGYMARNVDLRENPAMLLEHAKSIIVVLQNYFPKETQKDPLAPVLSKYAYGKDYHFVMKDKLKKLQSFINDEVAPCQGRAFVDSAPVFERAWARKAGLGWVGKNSNLISLKHGSFFFIGELILDIELPATNKPELRDHCGSCTKCLDACPTKAIVANKVVDATKCISYQTIELNGDLDETLKGQFENRVFGCDICQDVCPWNLKAKAHDEPGFRPDSLLMGLSVQEWHQMEKPQFDKLFRKSAVKRAKFEGLKRNLRFLEK